MALQAAGEWFASAFVDVLLEKFSSSVIDHWISVATEEDASNSGLHHDLRRLRTALLKTQAVLIGVESRQINNYSLVALLRELKDAAYDADDLIDEFQYRILQQRVEGPQRKRKFSSFFNIFSQDDDATTQIREIAEKLDRACADVGEILKLVDPVGGVKQFEFTERRETSSFLTEPVVLGRDKEIEDVVKLLLLSGDGNQNVSVLPIVGMGGIGKTTLAQGVYNDQRVEQYFQLKMWVYVSANFDVKRLVREIIESATKEKPSDLTNLNTLVVILKEKLLGKRFLLVLDDMWNEERSNWENLFTTLKFGAPGSMILITTRSQNVSAIVGTMDPISLEGLAEDSYWSLFKKCAFGDRCSEEHLVLEDIGKKIIKKLKGSPLAAKTIGGLLSINLTEKHWRSIMESDMWDLLQNEDDIFPVLRLSYHYLPAHLKQCFAYCAIFPKGYGFEKDHLVQMWMAQGFIKAQGNMRMEDIGSDYFDDLFCRSFFHQSRWSMLSSTNYEMHDLINDLAQSISVDDCFRLEGDRSREIPKMVRHLSLCAFNMKTSEDLFKFKKLRTLVFCCGYESDFDPALHELFKELTRIRVISFRNYFGIKKLPDTISNLKHLRFLDLCGTNIERLPESLCSLYNMQVLNIQGCRHLHTLPEGMCNLINLRRLEMDHLIFSPPSMTAGNIGKLNSLQTFYEFKVLKQVGHSIGELKDMNELRGNLCISNLENVENKEEASEAALNNKKHLEALKFKWTTSWNGETDMEVLKALQPHPNLKELTLIGYGGLKSPSWLEDRWLSNLKAIYLKECPKWEVLPPLGQLSALKILYIRNMDGVKQLGEHFYGRTAATSKAFPSLENLTFEVMPNWEEWSWSGIEECQLFPRLKSLVIQNCPKLRELPPLPPTLTSWRIHNCPNLTVEDIRGLIYLQELDVDCLKPPKSAVPVSEEECCDDDVLLPSSLRRLRLPSGSEIDRWLPRCLPNLTSLSDLEINGCPHITSLPGDVLRHLTKLKYLFINDCEEMALLGGLQTLVSLQRLEIKKCPKLIVSWDEVEDGDGLKLLWSLNTDNSSLLTGWLLLKHQPPLEALTIDNCAWLTCFTDEQEQWLQNLTSLWSLSILDCVNLESLPVELQAHSCLDDLHLGGCPKIQSLPEKGLPMSLQHLVILDCPVLEERCRKEEGPDWIKISHIPHIQCGRSS